MADRNQQFSRWQLALLFVTRIVVGWHLLYEGLVKVFDSDWTSASYLASSQWILSEFFHHIAATPWLLQAVDFINIWALIIIGLCLMIGVIVKLSAVTGAALLLLYYLANPPFLSSGAVAEGNYLIINKNLVEFFVLLILASFPVRVPINFRPLKGALHKVYKKIFIQKAAHKPYLATATRDSVSNRRRIFLKGASSLPFLGAFAYAYLNKHSIKSYEEENLVDAYSGASVKKLEIGDLKELEGEIGVGKIKDKAFSRLILGGNLLSGWAHSRDLIYVSQLVRAYHQKDKIFTTLLMAEKCGVNTLLTNPVLSQLINEYWDQGIGKIQFISDCAGLQYDDQGPHAMPVQEYMDKIQQAIDRGACACYIQGETADYYMSRGQVDVIEEAIKLIQDNNIIYGIGAHRIETIKASVDAGFNPDFWMKTLHHHKYWSASHPEWHDNKYCFNPEETIAYMESLPQPWIAFKVMAAGAIKPEDGFKYAFENGADFVCAGMYDFQMVKDVNIACNILNHPIERKRGWMA